MSNFLASLLEFFKPARFPADNPTEPAQITRSKVLVIVYDPVMDSASGATLSRQMKWYNTGDLLTGFMGDLLETSKGLARYEVVERLDVNEFPVKVDGFRYTPQSYMDVIRRAAPPHMPQEVDYAAILSRFNILQRVARNEIDEVWIFAFPHAGFYESIMAGPGAFWCNAPPLANTSASKRRFVIMGFSYERFVGEMLESYGHRAESIMEKTFSRLSGEKNLWKRFIRYEKSAPGKAACGNIHYAPNSQTDYDWGSMTPVNSECHDWLLNFPNFKGDVRTVNADNWGRGDIRSHHKWWFNHFPCVAGRKNGIHNNWWQYVVDPQKVIV
ncbi:MAG: hypothetical protein DPW18_20440 [Chloroflexi bacterium]|nr:hypothetical protein [Chloroflexota bacterium]MDL1944127.1 hypothetical protein [Chloroflexi bacterium CFX2]